MRWWETPIPPHGLHAEYAAHHSRLSVLMELRDFDNLAPWRWMRRLDGGFPPLLHVLSAALGTVLGQESERIQWTGLLWLAAWGAAHHRLASALSWSARACGYAAAIAMLLPPAHGLALRYYYDLPMGVFLVLGAAALVRHGRGTHHRGLAVATFWGTAACLTKWTAGPFFALAAVVVAALSRRATALLPVAGVVVVLLVLGGGDLRFQSVQSMAAGMVSDVGVAPVPPWLERLAGTSAPSMVLTALSPERWTPCRIAWHPAAWVRAWWSPLGFLAALPLLVAGLRGGGSLVRGAAMFLVLHLVFVVGVIRVLDERWDLPWVPLMVLLVAAGIDSRVRWAEPAAAVLIATLLWVGTHHHFSTPPLWNQRLEVVGCSPFTWPVARGLAAASTADGIALLRRDDEPPSQAEVRRALWSEITREPGERFALLRDSALIGDRQDNAYWAYAALESRALGDGLPRSAEPVAPLGDPQPADFVLTSVGPDGAPTWPFAEGPYRRIRRIDLGPAARIDVWRLP